MSKKKKKFTVPEFKTWLEGIMQFQDDDWSPTREQWDEIYDKIMNLKEPVNKEKVGLNEPTLDEINDIVYNNLIELKNSMNNQPINHGVNSPQGMDQNFPQSPPQFNPPPAEGNELANKSLSEIRQEAEQRQNSVGNHKLPDHDDASLPNDFV
jgi:hypothetical protein